MKKEYFENFDLAKFIAEDTCIVCGSKNVLENTPEENIPDHYDPPHEFPIIVTASIFFFVICSKCRKRVFNGLCLSCAKELDDPDKDFDYFVLAICQKFAEEYVRIKSELTKWIPKIQAEKKKAVSVGIKANHKKQKKLLKRLPK